MKPRLYFLSILLSTCLGSFGQQPDTLTAKPDSIIHLPGYFILLAGDAKQAFTKPFHMRPPDWKRFGIGMGALVAVSFADQPIQQFALDFRLSHPRIQSTSKLITDFGGNYELYTLGGLGLYGFIFKNERMKTATLLASQSYLTGAAVEGVMKYLFGRRRPSSYDPGVVAKPTFEGPFTSTSGSFPSGHTTVAFAAATVYALEYKDKPWVPIVCYTSASLIGLSRITENKHWATDVVAGAALGYLTGKLVVNNYHRYAALKAAGRPHGSLSLSMQYQFGKLMPGFVYKF